MGQFPSALSPIPSAHAGNDRHLAGELVCFSDREGLIVLAGASNRHMSSSVMKRGTSGCRCVCALCQNKELPLAHEWTPLPRLSSPAR